jgi:hypothetical protein
MTIAALHWSIREHYLLPVLTPGIRLVPVVPGEAVGATLDRMRHPEHPLRVVLIHIDSSTPSDFVRPFEALQARLEAEGVEVWNGAVVDIRKRSIQAAISRLGLPSTLAPREGAADEPVIVKTNLNARGIPEWETSDEHRAALGWGPRTPSPLHDRTGYIVTTRGEVPAAWWDDPQVIVERYIDNPYGVFYRVYFVGEQVVVCEGRSRMPVRRMSDATDRYDFLLDRQSAADPLVENVLGTPASEAFMSAVVCSEAYGLDYGCIDLVVDERGVPFVVDVNATPHWGTTDGPDEMLRHLRRGLS